MNIRITLTTLLSLGMLVTSMMSFAADAETDAVLKKFEERIPGMPITSIEKTPVPGIYEIVSEGQVYYTTEDSRYMFRGNLIDLERREDLTAARLSGIQMTLVNALGDDNMLIYEPEETAERTVTVFTDTSCPYCSKLHAERDELLAAGVRIRYLMFPRAGVGSDAHRQLESVWCADDPQAAMTTAKAGGSVPEKTCDNPIESHIALAEQVGLRGTPMIFLDSGEVIPGYQPASELVRMIKESEPLQN